MKLWLRHAEGGKAARVGAAPAAGNGSNGGAEWRVLMSHEHKHFDHTVVDDPPHMPGSRARLSVITPHVL